MKYHLIWITKYCRSFLIGEFGMRLHHILSDIAHEYGFKIIVQEGMPDHIHMVLEARPTDAPTRIVQILESISVKKMREEFLDIMKQHIWKEGTLWMTGYYIARVEDGVTTQAI